MLFVIIAEKTFNSNHVEYITATDGQEVITKVSELDKQLKVKHILQMDNRGRTSHLEVVFKNGRLALEFIPETSEEPKRFPL